MHHFLMVIFAGVAVMFVWSCEPSGSTKGNERRATTVDPCKSENPPPSCVDKKDETTGNDDDKDDDVPPADGDLPAYLYSVSEAAKIRPFVETLKRIKAEDDAFADESSSYSSLKSFFTTFLKSLMGNKDLAPGRNFQVHILKSDDLNAFADGDENIAINTGYIKNADVMSMLATICHEAAHSTRNHAAKRKDFFDKEDANFTKIYGEIDVYYEKTYNTKTSTYTHNKSSYLALIKKWEAAVVGLNELIKKRESEADIVGAAICAFAGMPSDKYIEGYQLDAELAAKVNGSEEVLQGRDLDDGESFEISSEELERFIFPLDTHPTDKERVTQLKRVRDVFEKHLATDGELFVSFKNDFTAKRGLGLLGSPTDLATLRALQTKAFATTKGRNVVIVKKPFCTQGTGVGRPK